MDFDFSNSNSGLYFVNRVISQVECLNRRSCLFAILYYICFSNCLCNCGHSLGNKECFLVSKHSILEVFLFSADARISSKYKCGTKKEWEGLIRKVEDINVLQHLRAFKGHLLVRFACAFPLGVLPDLLLGFLPVYIPDAVFQHILL